MIHEFTYGKLADETEKRQLGQIIEQCFIGSPSNTEPYLNRIGVENFRVIRQAKEVVGGLGLLPMGQWYGGVCVPMTGIAAVGIAVPVVILAFFVPNNKLGYVCTFSDRIGLCSNLV